jgi:molybdate-binding protein
LELDFVPLLQERFDLVVPDDLRADERVLRLFDTLASGSFRSELEQLGYDTRACAQKIADIDSE